MCNKHKLLAFGFVLILSLFFVSTVSAQVVINEVSSASNPEWVELYNISSSSASLKEHTIDFGSDSQKKFFCSNEQIVPNGYKLIILTSNWLNNAGDVVNLRSGDDIVDTIGYGSGYSLAKPNSGTDSITRSPDGSGTWIMTNKQSQQGDIVSFDCPTPTPTPTPTPSPTPSPTTAPTATPTATPTKTPSPTSKPINTSTPTSKPTSTPLQTTSGQATSEEIAAPQSIVLGLQDKSGEDEASESAEEKKSFSFLPFLFIAAGLVCIGVALFLVLKKGKAYNEKSEENI